MSEQSALVVDVPGWVLHVVLHIKSSIMMSKVSCQLIWHDVMWPYSEWETLIRSLSPGPVTIAIFRRVCTESMQKSLSSGLGSTRPLQLKEAPLSAHRLIQYYKSPVYH